MTTIATTMTNPTFTAATSVADEVNAKLGKLAEKQAEWGAVPPEEKLAMLEGLVSRFLNECGMKGLEEFGKQTAAMEQVEGKEADFVVSAEKFSMAVIVLSHVGKMIDTYKFRVGKSSNQEALSNIPTRKVGNQVVADVFPITPEEKGGPNACHKGELWFDKNKVKEVEDAKPFQFDALDESKEEGVMVILGAGNYSVLTFADILSGLFVHNNVVFVKIHPIRYMLEPLFAKIFGPLREQGYIDFEVDQGIERSQAIVYSPHVKRVHLTGGKPIHDTIVWGSTLHERELNMANQTPKCNMTSELGAVTPFLITPAVYTDEELKNEAQFIVSAKFMNGGASCNSPQVLLVSDKWEQRDAFVDHIIQSWEKCEPSRTYYPNVEKRWAGFRQAYQNAKIIRSEKSTDDEKYLPLLLAEVEVDLSTEQGRAEAKSEYGLLNEAFATVFIVATVKSENGQDFMNKAVEIANDYCFGSLSCSIGVPASAEGTVLVEKAIEDLKYGTIALNAWSATAFLNPCLTWGGYPGETLDAIESGIGKVANGLIYANTAKSVLRVPLIGGGQFNFVKSFEEIEAELNGITAFLMGVQA